MVHGRRGLPLDDDGERESSPLGAARRSAPSPPEPDHVTPPLLGAARRSATSPPEPDGLSTHGAALGSAARRSAVSPPEPDEVPRGPRRGQAEESEPAGERPTSRGAWYGLAALGVVLAIVVGALYVVMGRSDTAAPSPSLSPTTSQTPGTEAPTQTASSSPDSTTTQATTAPVQPPTTPAPETEVTTPEAPATTPPTLEPSPTSPAPEPTETGAPTPTQAGVPLDLGEATIVVRPGWQLYADETVQDDRRLIRMRELTTDTRIQAVVLGTVADDLEEACLALVADQRVDYSAVAESLAVTVPTGAGSEGISCAFSGVRLSDSVPNKVEFTLVRRESDGLTLFFRDTIPTAVAADSPVLAQLTGIECAAADTFAVTIAACSITPGQGDG